MADVTGPLDVPLINMERQDGRDPFDPQTYYSENGLTITTMVELRVFCASFFESHVRHNMDPTPEETMTKFIKLITDSDFFFARARAVPLTCWTRSMVTLRLQHEHPECSGWRSTVQVFSYLTSSR